MTIPPMIIAGGGICGLATALTLHQIGVPFRVFEAVPKLRPLGVGINLQPNAVRELFDKGIDAPALDTVGVPAREWAMVGPTATTSMRNRAAKAPATAGRKSPPTEAASICC